MKIKIELDISNVAFEDDDREVDKVLEQAAKKVYSNRVIEECYESQFIYDTFESILRDSNGNKVGTVAVLED